MHTYIKCVTGTVLKVKNTKSAGGPVIKYSKTFIQHSALKWCTFWYFWYFVVHLPKLRGYRSAQHGRLT